jgi:hypothetical protein
MKSIQRNRLLMHGCASLLLLLLFCLKATAAEKPNILIIFTDDQGYADLACYGNKKNKTPLCLPKTPSDQIRGNHEACSSRVLAWPALVA